MVRKEVKEVRLKAGGTGIGETYFYHIVSKEELRGHGRLFAKIVIPPGSTIGWHQHVGESEPYYILSGEGDFTDNDGTVTKVHAGDICVIEVGQFHCIANNGTEDLALIALIYNE